MHAFRLTASAVTAVALVGASVLPAAADTLPPEGCTTDCTATFDTVGAAFDFDVPTTITELTVTVAGSAGAPPSFAITNDPTAVGGNGGVTTVALGTEYAGETLVFGVGDVGGGSYVQDDGGVLVVAGGGGQGGYAALFQLPGQIPGTYPGGDGGAPTAPGIAVGGTPTAFGALPANGGGGTDLAGVGGTGDANGTAGGAVTLWTPTSTTLAVGGDGGSYAVGDLTHEGGVGGGGLTGGGGGAIDLGVEAGDIPVDVVAPGGGGSGYLDVGLTGVAREPNTGGGYVSFTWSLATVPTPPVLPATGSEGTLWLAAPAAALLALGAFLLWRRSSATHERALGRR